MDIQYIHNLTFDGERCKLQVADKPAGDPSVHAHAEVVYSREDLRTKLKVCSIFIPQRVTTDGVFFHPDVFSAVSDWLIHS